MNPIGRFRLVSNTLLSKMIEIRVNGNVLVMVRPEMLKGDSPYLFFYHLLNSLYANRDKTLDIAFMTYLDSVGYSRLKALYFMNTLPSEAFNLVVELCSEYSNESVNLSTLFESGMDSIERAEAHMKFGAQVDRLLR